MDTPLEVTEYRVPIDSGHLIGNTLRQFAMRGTYTWQPAAYRIAGKEGTFGLKGGYPFSILKFLEGYMVPNKVKLPGTEQLKEFVKDGSDYVCDGMVIKGLEGIGAPSIEVCLVYANGSRTKEQNRVVAERLCQYNVKDYVAVPSRHNPTIRFNYEIQPYDLTKETLIIRATQGVVSLAVESISDCAMMLKTERI